MPLSVLSGDNPIPSAKDKSVLCAPGQKQANHPNGCLRIALVNNMPDSALEDTEFQFFELLSAASEEIPIQVALYSLPGVQRSDRARQHLDQFYSSTTVLRNQRVDGVVITGTEPLQSDLRNEPYWDSLSELFNWAEENTLSAVLSCLAAHASSLQSDGIRRHPIGNKRFGVFEHQVIAEHPLTHGVVNPVRIPHSRWNELRRGDLELGGYKILTESSRAGVDLFVKEKKKSLFVHFQGHPEYLAQTLHKEYRRDVKRYLRMERENYPLVPESYFDPLSVNLLGDFRAMAERERRESIMESFPEAQVVETLQHSWRPAAVRIYQNWLNYLTLRKAQDVEPFFMARVGQS